MATDSLTCLVSHHLYIEIVLLLPLQSGYFLSIYVLAGCQPGGLPTFLIIFFVWPDWSHFGFSNFSLEKCKTCQETGTSAMLPPEVQAGRGRVPPCLLVITGAPGCGSIFPGSRHLLCESTSPLFCLLRTLVIGFRLPRQSRMISEDPQLNDAQKRHLSRAKLSSSRC